MIPHLIVGIDDIRTKNVGFCIWTLSRSSLHNFLIWKKTDFNLWVNCHKII